jgi:hypothetical protein
MKSRFGTIELGLIISLVVFCTSFLFYMATENAKSNVRGVSIAGEETELHTATHGTTTVHLKIKPREDESDKPVIAQEQKEPSRIEYYLLSIRSAFERLF